MLKKYPKFKRGQAETVFNKLSEAEQKLIEDYLFYRKSRGLGNSNDLRRYIIQVRKIIDCDFKKFDTLDKLSRLSVLINESYLSKEVKKNLRINLKHLFKYLFPSKWHSEFMELDCFSNKKKKGEESEDGVISHNDLPTDKNVEDMLKTEPTTFYKTFLLLQNSTGLRTIENRKVEINKITFDKDGTSRIEIFMTKTGKSKYVFPDKQTTDHIKKLIEELKNTGRIGKYLFPSISDSDKPIPKNTINKWFKNLSKKATGRFLKPYWLRHKHATKLYDMAMNNIISKDVATKLLGHSKDMSERYIHRPKEKEIAILKDQAFNTEISEKQKNEYLQRIDTLEKQFAEYQKFQDKKWEELHSGISFWGGNWNKKKMSEQQFNKAVKAGK